MKKSKKFIMSMISIGMAFTAFATACGEPTTESEETIPPYDYTVEHKPTDENEEVVSLNANDYSYYNNSIELYDDGGNVYDIGDPYVFRYDGKYYLYTSLNGDRRQNGQIPCWVSDNLIDWEFSNWIYDPGYTNAVSPSYIAFAPEIVYYKGWFYMCESRRGDGHYFFRCATPDGDYERISGNLGMGIDGSFYLANDGKLWFMFADANEEFTSKKVCYVQIDFVDKSDGSVEVVVDQDTLQTLEEAYLGGWTEGPGYFTRNGYQYLTYTGNHVDSASYRVGYSSTTNASLFKGLSTKNYNITLASSGMDNAAIPSYDTKTGGTVEARATNFRGLGHSSNVVGPNMDSIYTAFHNADRVDYDNTPTPSTGTRQYNLTQYYTNNSYVLTNGLGNYQKTMPTMPDYTAAASDLEKSGDTYLSTKETEAVFTAELSFRLNNNKGTVLLGQGNGNGAKIAIDGTKLTYTAPDGSTASATVAVSTNTEAVHTVKVINGYKNVEIYYDNIRVIKSAKCVPAGKVGYTGCEPSSTCFTNDAFGTSDFDSVKDLTGSWAAYAYMKGENRGYSVKNASVRSDGVRQGEKESTKYVSSIDATAVTLKAGDWVKYAVNAPESGSYALNMLLGAKSKGCIVEVIVDNQTIEVMEVPKTLKTDSSGYINFHLGTFDCSEGLHTLKIRVYGGTLDFANVYTELNKEVGETKIGAKTEFSDTLEDKEATAFTALLGTQYSHLSGVGVKTDSGTDVKTLLVTGKQGIGDYEISVDVKIASGFTGGILFRMDNYCFNESSTTSYEGWQGYYLEFNAFYVSLTKKTYSFNTELGTEVPDRSDSFNKELVNVKVRCEGGSIKVWLNDYLYIESFDYDPFLTGYIGLYSSKSSLVFQNFSYKEI